MTMAWIPTNRGGFKLDIHGYAFRYHKKGEGEKFYWKYEHNHKEKACPSSAMSIRRGDDAVVTVTCNNHEPEPHREHRAEVNESIRKKSR